MLNLQIIIASTRESRSGPLVARWFEAIARRHPSFSIEVVDLAEVNLPLFDEPRHPRLGEYEYEHTRAWSVIVDRADAYVFVTPEYDHGAPASLINALQYLVREWAYKPAAFVSYGGVSGGTRGVQMTKQIVAGLKMVPLFEAVAIPFFTRYVDQEKQVFNPGELQEKAAVVMLDELAKWAGVLKPLRSS